MTMTAHILCVDPIACTGEGVCADLFPEWIRLDDWGYPVVDPGPVPADRLPHARWAADNCPALALKLEAVRASRHGEPASAAGSVRRGPG
jgi:ferredoxin